MYLTLSGLNQGPAKALPEVALAAGILNKKQIVASLAWKESMTHMWQLVSGQRKTSLARHLMVAPLQDD